MIRQNYSLVEQQVDILIKKLTKKLQFKTVILTDHVMNSGS